MRILWNIHLYPPKHNCGSEYMAHWTNKFLQSCGHEVKVLHQDGSRYGIKNIYTYDGVDVFPPDNVEGMFRWADVIFTHLEYSKHTIKLAYELNKPVVFFSHNSSSVYNERIRIGKVGIVYNSKWMKDHYKWENDGFVLNPPVDWRHYDVKTEEGEYITLINLSINKGGEVFYILAEKFPDKKFLGVKGSYDAQIRDDRFKNVEIIENTPDILEVYKKTRILIMPSSYESWGRTATEAMCNGIPVVCTPTPGLKENCDYAGIYCTLDSIDHWIKAIKKLDKPAQYEHYSKLAIKRSRELDPGHQLEQFNIWLQKFVRG